MTQHRDGDTSDDGDRRSVDEFGSVRAHERRSQQQTRRPVHDELRLAGDGVAHQRRPRRRIERDGRGHHVHSGALGVRERLTHPGHLRHGEHHLRSRDVLGHVLGYVLVAPDDGGAEHPRLVLAQVGEEPAPPNVADGVEPLGSRRVVPAQRLGGALTSGHGKHFGCGERPATRGEGDACVRAGSDGDVGAEDDGDALVPQRRQDELACERLLAVQQRIPAHEHRHVTAVGLHPRRGFTGHDPATDNEQPLRDVLDARHLTVRPRLNLA